jgi:hypothetical protein
MALSKRCCLHCRAFIPRKARLCPVCDRWQDEQSPWVELLQGVAKLRGTLIFLGLLIGFLIWAFRHVE